MPKLTSRLKSYEIFKKRGTKNPEWEDRTEMTSDTL